MADLFNRSNLKNWVPGAAAIAALLALVAFAGISSNRSDAISQAPDAAPVAQAKSEPPLAAKAKEANKEPAKSTAATPAPQPTAKTAPPAQAANSIPAPQAAPPATAASNKADAKNAPQHNHGHTMAAAPTPAPAAGAAASRGAAVAVKVAEVEGDVAHGRQVFKKCQACHSMQPGKNMLGPSLAGIVGSKAGEVANYSFSPAMKQSGITWTAEKLDAYLLEPQKVVPGNKMPFPGLKTNDERTDVIAFLASSANAAPASGNPAVAPPAPAASAAGTAPAPAAATPPAQQNAARPRGRAAFQATASIRAGSARICRRATG